MKYLLLAGLFATQAHAAYYRCRGGEEKYVAWFETSRVNNALVVDFQVREGAAGKVFVANCPHVRDAAATYSCEVSSGMESGYTLLLQSEGANRTVASVTPWSMSGPEQAVPLRCTEFQPK